MSEFRGWPPEAIEFLRELEANNDRDWFKANRARYDEYVVGPTKALGDDLSDLGRPHTFRPWNDTRFHQAPPIKEHVGLAVGYEGAGGLLRRAVARRPADRRRPAQPGARPGRPLPPRARRRPQGRRADEGDRQAQAGRAAAQRAGPQPRPARLPARPPAHRAAQAPPARRDAAPRARRLDAQARRRQAHPHPARRRRLARALAAPARRPERAPEPARRLVGEFSPTRRRESCSGMRSTAKLPVMVASRPASAERSESLGVFSPRRAGQLAGVGGDRIGQWARHGLIRPTIHEGPPANRYAFNDVAEAIAVHWLHAQGFGYDDIRLAIRKAGAADRSWPLLQAAVGVAHHGLERDRGVIALRTTEGQYVEIGRPGDQTVLEPELFDQASDVLRQGGWLARELGLARIEVDPQRGSAEPRASRATDGRWSVSLESPPTTKAERC